MQLNGASGLRAGKRQRKRVQELAAAKAAHYDGICLARWRRISVRGRFCMPEPAIYRRDSSHCLSHLPCWVSNRLLPEAALGDELYSAVVCFVQYSEVRLFAVSSVEILPKHLLRILGPSNRHGPTPHAEAVAFVRSCFSLGEAVETSDI